MRRAALAILARSPQHPLGAARVFHHNLGLGRSSGRRSASYQAKRSIAQLLQWKPAEKVDNVVVEGFVRSVRSMKMHRFVSLRDGSSLAPLQAVVHADHAHGCELLSPTCVSRLRLVSDPVYVA